MIAQNFMNVVRCKLNSDYVEIIDLGRVSNTKAQKEWEQVIGEA